MQFGIFLKRAMQDLQVTQAELAARADVSQGAVSRYLNGKASPKAEELLRIAGALGVTMEWLLTGNQDHVTVLRQDEVPYRVRTKQQQEGEAIALELEALASRVRSFFAC
jgi:transcriptional regulator with XRE-family HTH domain